ncbi:MAG: anaerobic sulfatase maturase [Proteobacteria bacterium]|nr:anaerobic sulfatase maturase [Pseudomonadota bacterium]
MYPFTLLIKPASADCNLRCEYCFYLKKSCLYPDENRHRMAHGVLERLIQGYMETDQPAYGFGWQGGEPTLMGADFFKTVTLLQEKYGRPGSVVSNGLQTNATLITEEMAGHFAAYKFLVGVSLDGPPDIHNRYRKTIHGEPTHGKVIQGIEILKKHRVDFNILTLVSQSNVSSPQKVYEYLVKNGHRFHQYIPCVEFDDKGHLLPHAVTGKQWGDFLCEVFDLWYPKDSFSVSVRHFDAILHKLVDGRVTVCQMGRNCGDYYVVEFNGDVYPCDFFVEEGLKLGNIMENSWEEITTSSVAKDFGSQKCRWNSVCMDCPVLDLCMGDCLKHRMVHQQPPEKLSWLCEGWKQFLNYSRSRFEGLAQDIRHQRKALGKTNPGDVHTPGIQKNKTGRNAPCPCGSGKKFKKCCGA